MTEQLKERREGVIVRGIAGFYYVDAGGTVYQSRARGLFRKKGKTPLVGDRVAIEIQDDGGAWITAIRERRNAFIRPPVANVETLVLVLAAKRPDPLPLIADRFLVMAEAKHADVVIVINKEDLADREEIASLADLYRGLYPVYVVSAADGKGMEDLRSALTGRIAALAGPSGVGKSTILNALIGRKIAETGETSERLGRGKQTTRASELYAIGDGTHIFDTPGFTSFSTTLAAGPADEIEEMESELTERDLSFCFPEFAPHLGRCRFDDCLHRTEPDCAVRKAVEIGSIAPSRYASYRTILEELKNRKRY